MTSVIVVGSGGAGMSAAVSAAENGADVLVLDRAKKRERGGNTLYTEAFFRLASDSELSPGFVNDFVVLSDGRCDLPLVETLAANAVPTIQWIRDMGVRIDHLPQLYVTPVSRPRLGPTGGGAAILDALELRARDLGVNFLYERSAHSLKVVDGRVIGVEVIDPTGRGEDCDADAIILSCGGFEGNPEMESEHLDGPVEGLHLYAPGARFNQGDGIEMARRVRARPAGDFDKFHAALLDPRSELPAAGYSCHAYGVLLNRNGERFVDESVAQPDAWYEEVARAIWHQPGSIGFIILDASFFDLPNHHWSIRTEQAPITADSLEDLVHKLPFENRDRAMQTLRAYNEAAKPGPLRNPTLDGVAAIVNGVPKSNWAYALQSPPFRAFPIVCANVFTFGGLQITPEARVVSVEGSALRGLFAAGEIVGLYYGRYVGATSVMRGLVFGRIAGRVAARGA